LADGDIASDHRSIDRGDDVGVIEVHLGLMQFRLTLADRCFELDLSLVLIIDTAVTVYRLLRRPRRA
jgi:hypothetical protein